ncbi:MAG TPA: hypothetical protein VIM76_07740 [Candidatus Dormibacteraeota bacterium]|jgi:hypothetical protein
MISAFRRGKPSAEAPAKAPALAVGPSGISCSARGCLDENAQPCGYRDRHGKSCGVARCAAHGVVLHGVAYCRRHASTLQAIDTPSGHANDVADVDDRAPSLVNWIANDLDTDVRRLLAEAAQPGETVLTDGFVQLTRDKVRKSRWERSWRIVDHTGLVVKVVIYTDEDDAALVHVRVGDRLVAEGVPPWIASRQDGEESTPTLEISRRQQFYKSLEESIGTAVHQTANFRRG